MKTVIATLLLIAVITFLIIAMIGRKETVHHHKFIALFFLFYFIDNLAITLANRFPEVQLIPNHVWGGFLICSWSGKMYSVFIMLLLLYLFRPVFNDYEVGLSLQQSKGSLLPSAVIILAITLWSSFVGSKSPPGAFDPPTLIYLAVMPGLNEELVYRGILPVCLGRLFPANWNVASARIGWAIVIPTVLFGLLHGLWVDEHFKLHLEVIWIRNALLSGFIFAWLKERTGSLIMPTIAHGTWDFFLFLPRMI
jgi:hypothetical protein